MDKMTKLLLTAIVLLLGGILLRPASNPAFAQSAVSVPVTHAQPALAVSGSDVYILQNNTLYIYEWSNEFTKELTPTLKPSKFNLIMTRPLKTLR